MRIIIHWSVQSKCFSLLIKEKNYVNYPKGFVDINLLTSAVLLDLPIVYTRKISFS
jgi:hypothetical protein